MNSTPQSARKIAGAIRHRLVLAVENLRIQDRTLILKALTFAEGHYHQYRKKTKSFPDRGVPLIVHPMRVALVLIEELSLKDTGAITAALLHELVEWKRDIVSIADIERSFGRPIAMLVSILTKPPIAEDTSEEEKQQGLNIYYRRIEQASIVSKIVKLADRLDSVREAPEWLDTERQEKYLEETRTIYLPIAEATDGYLFEELNAAVEALEESMKKNNGADTTSFAGIDDVHEISAEEAQSDASEEETESSSSQTTL